MVSNNSAKNAVNWETKRKSRGGFTPNHDHNMRLYCEEIVQNFVNCYTQNGVPADDGFDFFELFTVILLFIATNLHFKIG